MNDDILIGELDLTDEEVLVGDLEFDEEILLGDLDLSEDLIGELEL